tara:strand:- start:1106 stop:2251 length:1146 start_codon:yes stop_codon:yes gene_type:complete
MKKILTALLSLLAVEAMSQNITQPYWFNNQVSIGNSVADQCAILGINSTNKGFLLPRMLAGDRNAIRNPSKGLMVYQTDGTAGIYYNAGTPTAKNWVRLFGGSVTGTPLRIPYFNSLGNLTSDIGFYRDSINGETRILSIKGDTNVFLQIIPAYGAVVLTAEDTVAAKSSAIAATVGSIIMVNESPNADTRIDMGDYSMAISATSALANLQQSRIIIDTTQITFVSGEKFGFQSNYSFPTDTGSVGQVLGVATNDGLGINTLSWQTAPTSGHFAPVISNDVNLTASANNIDAMWTRIGDIVTVQYSFLLDPTVTLTNTTLDFTYPVAANPSADVAGQGVFSDAIPVAVAVVSVDAAHGQLKFTPTATANTLCQISITYRAN